MTEVNRLLAFSPPLRFPLFTPVPLFSRTANGVSSETPVGFSEESPKIHVQLQRSVRLF